MSPRLEFDLTADEAEVFLQEADELLVQLNEGLVQLESSPGQPEVIQEVFRAAHTLKGSAGVIGHHRMAEVLHAMETLLDRVRHGQVTVSSDLIDVLLDATDAVRSLVGEVARAMSDSAADGAVEAIDPSALLESLGAFVSGAADLEEEAEDWQPLEVTPEQRAQLDSEASPAAAVWEVRVRIDPESVAPGARALQVLLALEQSARVLMSLPTLAELDDDWSGHSVQALVVTDGAEALGELLGTISEIEAEFIPRGGGDASPGPAQEATPDAVVDNGNRRNGSARASSRDQGQVRWVRTSVERLDTLMNLVSELVTDRNRLFQVRNDLTQRYGDEAGLAGLAEALAHVSSITDQLQDEVMRARMVPIELVFNRFPRVVRDLARQLGKQVELVIEGQDTELDRTVIEEINDPIMHLVRNCVDHGIELPEVRARMGKPEKGRLRLAARSEESHIIITVEDDGAGIDGEGLRAAAVAKGLLDPESARALSDQEAVELIFRAGFSTAHAISDVSGRGVGMDVVRANIERLNGTVSVHTVPGQGTRFELKLPLTLAIFPALMVEVAGSAYAMPLTAVVEALQVKAERIQWVRGRETIVTRGRVLPILSLERFFGCAEAEANGVRHIVEVRWGDTTLGLSVGKLLGRQEVVIKPLGRMIGEVPGISGGTILGDGRVALIIDIGGLVRTGGRE